ncbi:MAG: DUF488 family protein [Terriglobales bacterium]
MPQANRLKLPTATVKEQFASKDAWNHARSADGADFFTFGYSARKTEEIIVLLVQHGIQTVVDIRYNPVSMYRPELSKRNLATVLAKNGIGYVHMPEFGVPRDIRAKAIEAGRRDVIWNWYDKYVIAPLVTLYHFLNAYEHPVAMMCTEVNPRECHRHRLSVALEKMGLTSFDL